MKGDQTGNREGGGLNSPADEIQNSLSGRTLSVSVLGKRWPSEAVHFH